MRKNEFKVVADNQEDYHDELKEFTEMMTLWSSNKEGREFDIEENEENLKFKIIAKEYGEN